ncbi:restriction endonuclease subunit S [Mycolicibacterium fortuitum]|uniref:restriction endonuclease subunit S n=1 Tax=Mycolicibacterium fortuitum TaxID=1766 RepID=UPI002607AF0C|nr:restriction endonuclease subunit S [Mycolicibacterium fortuitum]
MTSNASWGVLPLGDAGTWVSGGTPRTSNLEYWGGDIPWMSSKSMTEFHVRTSDRLLTPLGAQSGTKVVPKDTILMVVRGMSLKSEFRMGIAQREVALSQDLKGLIPGPQFDPLFLAYAIKSKASQVLNMVDEAGHGTGRLQTDRLFALELPKPPIEEQRAIAATLRMFDEKIDSNRTLIGLLDEWIRATFAKDFSTVEDPDGVPISDLVEVNPRRPLAKGASSTYVGMSSLPEFWPVVSTWETKPFGSGQRFRNGDVLLARITPCLENGKTAIVDMLAKGEIGWGSTEYVVLSPRGDLTSAWVYGLARDETIRNWAIRSMSGTSGRQRFDASRFHQYRIAAPDPNAIGRFNDLTTPALARISALRDESLTLAALRDTLISELLSGRVRVPAEVAA